MFQNWYNGYNLYGTKINRIKKQNIIKVKKYVNGKAFAVYVCQSTACRSTYIDARPHIMSCDNFKMEHLSFIACSETLYVFK